MLRVKPGEWFVRMKRSRPLESAVRLDLHTKQGKGQAGEIVVVDAGVDKRCRKADLATAVSFALVEGDRGCKANVWH